MVGNIGRASRISPYISEGSGLKHCIPALGLLVTPISPYISEGSGLKPGHGRGLSLWARISPYISEGSGLKHCIPALGLLVTPISPYISEGSGLKHVPKARAVTPSYRSPLTSVRGAD